MFHSAQLQLIHLIQQGRNPLLDSFFTFLDFFDRQEFLFILIPAFWLGKHWKAGFRLFCLLFCSSLANHVFKTYFAAPRPFHLDPSLAIIQVHGYGFPSGAAQTVIILSGLLLKDWHNSWKWVICPLYILLISFSRVYLGLHFPTDILGGWMVGLALFAGSIYLTPYLEKQPERYKTFCLIPLLLLLVVDSPSLARMSACALGICIGLWTNQSRGWRLTPPTTRSETLLRGAIGVIGTFAAYFLLSKTSLPVSIRFCLLGFWLATGSLLLVHKFFSSSVKTNA